MQINEQVVENFKNLAQVNPQIKLTSDCIRHASEDKECILYWNWNQTLDKDVPIYDMNYLLRILDMYENIGFDKVICEEETDGLIIKLKDGRMENTYRYGIEEDEINDIFIQAPTKEDFFSSKLTGDYVSFTITKNDVNILKKQIEINTAPHIILNGNLITITDKTNTSSNKFKMKIDATIEQESVIPTEKFSVLKNDEYKVDVYTNACVFTSKDDVLTYIIVKLDI